MPRAVLDPNVLVSALITPTGASAGLMVELRAGTFELITSPHLLAELGDVLGREKFRRYVTSEDADDYLETLRLGSIVVADPAPSGTPLSADPGDEYLIDLARAGRADVLVSGDQHLLGLRPTIPVLTTREFLDSLRPH